MITWNDIDRLHPVKTENLPRNRQIAGADLDSRRISEGMLFIARRGEKVDGHKFIGDALQKGALAALVEEDWYAMASPGRDWPLIVVRDTDDTLRELAVLVREKFDGPVLGITGSNGKTTTKEMVSRILSHRYIVLATPGNFNNLWGLPLTILRAQSHHDFWVLEHGMNRPGEIEELCRISQPNAGLITSISEVHSENFDSIEAIAEEKFSLFNAVPDDGLCFQNLSDPYIRQYRKDDRTISFGLDINGDFPGQILGTDRFERVLLHVENLGKARLPLPGEFQALNALAAVAVGVTFQVNPDDALKTLEEFPAIPGRTNILERHGKTVIDDSYNANPASMRAALDILSNYPAENRRVAILGDMLELNSTRVQKHRDLGEYAAKKGIDLIIGVGELSRYMVNAAEQANATGHHVPDTDACTKILSDLLEDGDVILVKGSHGIELERVVEAI